MFGFVFYFLLKQPTKTNVQNRQNTNERDARVSDIKRTAYKQSVAQARESLVVRQKSNDN